MGFTDTLKNSTLQVDFQKGGKTLFTSTTFGGYIGVISGIKKIVLLALLTQDTIQTHGLRFFMR